MDTIERIARRNRLRAEEVIRDSRLAEIWRSVGAEVRQVGSLRSGLLMKHRDIDFHIYSSPLRLEESFAAMTQLAADPAVGRIECRNLLATDEACVEWHATYRDRDGDEWQLDMIHIVRGSRYDGYFPGRTPGSRRCRCADSRSAWSRAAYSPGCCVSHPECEIPKTKIPCFPPQARTFRCKMSGSSGPVILQPLALAYSM